MSDDFEHDSVQLVADESAGKSTVVYIAGPMSGINDFNYPKFHEVSKFLRALGYDVRNPAENHNLNEITANPQPYEYYLRTALKTLLECDGLVLLPGWEDSKGAQLERRIAESIGMTVAEWKE